MKSDRQQVRVQMCHATHVVKGFFESTGPQEIRKATTIGHCCLKGRMRKRIVYIQYTNSGGYPPPEHSSRILTGAGWDVLGPGALEGPDALRFHPSIEVKQLAVLRGRLSAKAAWTAFQGPLVSQLETVT